MSSDKGGPGLSDPREEALAMEGEYIKFYETQGPIGKGAFGFVKMARRRSDNLSVSEPNPRLGEQSMANLQGGHKLILIFIILVCIAN